MSGDVGQQLVRFDCTLGTSVATWSSSLEPRVGAEYDVELDADVVLGPDNSELVSESEFSVSVSDVCSHLTGQLESIDDDYMGYLRLGPDTLVMIETIPHAYESGVWLRVTVPSRQLAATPFGSPSA